MGSFPHCGEKQGENLKLDNAAVYAEDGIIKAIASDGEIPVNEEDMDTIIDAEGKLVTPGLVEGHTHMVFGGYRQNEIPLKLKGAGYLDILRAGGGIMDTVRKTRSASFEELYEKTEGFLDEMMYMGVTTCEIKSGYGLDLENEIKMLEVIKKLNEDHPMDIAATFLGPHAIPEEYKGRADEFIDLCCEEMLPAVKEKNLAEFADIFTEDSVFNYEQSKKYLEAAKALGFDLKIHADEIEAIGGSVLAGEMKAKSAEHLIVIDEKGMKSLAEYAPTRH